MSNIPDQISPPGIDPAPTVNRLDDFSRLTALYRLMLLDSPPEVAFDRITHLLSKLLDAPVALMTLLDVNRQFFKSQIGLEEPWASARQTPLSHSFCQYVVMTGQPLIVTDARTDPLLATNRAIEDLNVIAYAGVPLCTEQGQVLGSLCVIDSVPRFWQNDELSILNDLAAMLMTEIELRRHLIESRQQNEELNAFSDMAAHDLRIPLNLIYGYLQLAQLELESATSDKLREYLERIAWGSVKMNNMISDLLMLTRVNQTGVKLEPLDMTTILTDVQTRLAAQTEQFGAVLKMPDFWPVALGYAPWIEEVWVNYISNALKYGGHPPVVTLGAEAAINGSVRFWVTDNGAGIPADQQVELFKPFSRLSGRPEAVEGEGLGLSIVKRIVEKLGGTVGVQSEIGLGSTFSFTLSSAPV